MFPCKLKNSHMRCSQRWHEYNQTFNTERARQTPYLYTQHCFGLLALISRAYPRFLSPAFRESISYSTDQLECSDHARERERRERAIFATPAGQSRIKTYIRVGICKTKQRLQHMQHTINITLDLYVAVIYVWSFMWHA